MKKRMIIAVITVALLLIGCGNASVEVTGDAPVTTDAPAITETPTLPPTATPTATPDDSLKSTAAPASATPERTAVPTPTATSTITPTQTPTSTPKSAATEAPQASTSTQTSQTTNAPTTQTQTPQTSDAHTHSWTETGRSESTDCFAGITTTSISYSCNCGETKTDTQTATSVCDWQWAGEWEHDASGCVRFRTAHHTCMNHGTVTTEVPHFEEVDEHDYTYTRHEPSCESKGEVTVICSKCNKHFPYLNETITTDQYPDGGGNGHQFIETSRRDLEYEPKELVQMTCSVCGFSYNEIVPK